jgi:hypothetical protein
LPSKINASPPPEGLGVIADNLINIGLALAKPAAR